MPKTYNINCRRGGFRVTEKSIWRQS